MGLDLKKLNPLKSPPPQTAPQAQAAQPAQPAQPAPAPAPKATQAKPANNVVADGFDQPKKAAPVALKGEAKEASGLGLPSWVSGSALKELGGKLWGQVTDKLGLESNIRRLGDGDKYSFGIGAQGSVGAGLAGTAYGKGKVEIERKDEKGQPPKYTVSVEAEGGLGVLGELGAKATGIGQASATLQQTYGLASKVEFSFSTPEEAARGAEILARQGLVSSNPSLAPFVGPSKEDMEFLEQNLASLELRGNGAAKLAGELGIGESELLGAGVFGEGNAKLETGVKIEFKDRKPTAVVVKSGGEVEVKGGVNATGAGARGTAAAGKVNISQETKFELPKDLSWSDFATDPAGAVRKVGGALQQTEQKLVIQQEFEATGSVGGAGFRAQAEYSGKPGTLPVQQLVQSAASGDFGGTLALAGNQVNVNLAVVPYTSQGFNFSPSVSFFGNGLGAEIGGSRQDGHPWRFQGTATEGVAALNQQLLQLPDWQKYIIV